MFHPREETNGRGDQGQYGGGRQQLSWRGSSEVRGSGEFGSWGSGDQRGRDGLSWKKTKRVEDRVHLKKGE